MKRKSVAHSKGVVGVLDVKKVKGNAKPATPDIAEAPKPQDGDYREFLDYKAHAYWALCESQKREAHVHLLQKRRLAKKGIAMADICPPTVAVLPAETAIIGPAGLNRGD